MGPGDVRLYNLFQHDLSNCTTRQARWIHMRTSNYHAINNANRTHRFCSLFGASMIIAACVGYITNRELQVVDKLSMLA